MSRAGVAAAWDTCGELNTHLIHRRVQSEARVGISGERQIGK